MQAISSTRPNLASALVVDNGLSLNHFFGRRTAAVFMHANGINFRVIVRVLAEPKSRRNHTKFN